MAAPAANSLALAPGVQAPSRATTPSQLAQEIAEARRYLASLRRTRNSRVPVAQIPVEILIHIFSFIKCHPRWPHRNPDRPPAWVAVTHVCQFWREVALSSPLLWSNIVTYNMHWMQETLARSKAAPISLPMYVNHSTWELPKTLTSVITHIIPHILRAKKITIHGANISSYVQPLFEHAAPWLEVLELSDIRSHFDNRNRILLPRQEALNLRTLRLKRCSFMWPIPTLFSPALTELKISHMLPEDRPSLLQIRAVLLTMPNLKILVLSDVLRKSPDSTAFVVDPASSTVSLPFLQSLSFTAEKAVDVVSFISQLIVPSNASLHLLCRTLDGFNVNENHGDNPGVSHSTPVTSTALTTSTSGLSYLLLSLIQFFRFDSPIVPGAERDVSYGCRSVGVVELDGDSDPRRDWCLLAGTHPRLGRYSSQHRHQITGLSEDYSPVWNACRLLGLPWQDAPDREHHITSILLNACLLLPLSKVDTVIISCDLYRDPALWWGTFGRLKHVKAVVVSGYALGGLAAALCGKGRPRSLSKASVLGGIVEAKNQDHQTREGVLFPELRHLKIENAYLGWEGVMDDLIEGLGGWRQNQELGKPGHQADRNPLFSLYIDHLSDDRQEEDRKSCLHRLIARPTVSTGIDGPDGLQWFCHDWATTKLDDYFW
ncbi:hypothetical protein BV25DRAFT_1921579 [Artomyces pyxidatus]|uniref:Uncharacterized protein n=1 Tax=Artomyces pyxidatus TaxID=48021 RepID=A0ACB8SHJ9_9AGAM|nr:hypothetical protein BV25DRAFT_1921579 [Artomyces pyxidatus]